MRSRIRSNLLSATLAALLALGAGRAAQPAAPTPDKAPPPRSFEGELRPGDRLRFSVREDPNLATELLVGSDGNLELPLLGQIVAAGKTIAQVTEETRKALESEYLVSATVRISLTERPEKSTKRGRVYLAGRMRKIGSVEIDLSDANTLGRVVLANGGLSEFADGRRVRIIRRTPDSETLQTIIVDLDEILQKGRIDKDIALRDGDFVIADAKLVNW